MPLPADVPLKGSGLCFVRLEGSARAMMERRTRARSDSPLMGEEKTRQQQQQQRTPALFDYELGGQHAGFPNVLPHPVTGRMPDKAVISAFSANSSGPITEYLANKQGPRELLVMRHYFVQDDRQSGLVMSADLNDSDDSDNEESTTIDREALASNAGRVFRAGDKWREVIRRVKEEFGLKWSVFDVVMGGGGLFHPKLHIYRYDQGPQPLLRVIVSSANFVADTTHNVLWMQDFPIGPGVGPPCQFQSDLDFFLRMFANDATPGNKRLRQTLDAMHMLKGVDFTGANGRLIFSIPTRFCPGKKVGVETKRAGLPLLQEAVADAKLCGASAEDHGIVCTNNVGNNDSAKDVRELNKDWFSDLAVAMGLSSVEELEVLYPSERAVYERTTLDGYTSMAYYGELGGYVPKFLRQAHYRYERAGKGPLWHVKMYMRAVKTPPKAWVPGGSLAWLMLGSHNCSAAAWGTLTRTPKNVELSVLMRTADPDRVRQWQETFPMQLPAPRYDETLEHALSKYEIPFVRGNGVAWVKAEDSTRSKSASEVLVVLQKHQRLVDELARRSRNQDKPLKRPALATVASENERQM